MLIFISAITAFAVVVGAYFCIDAKHNMENRRYGSRAPEVIGGCEHFYYDRLDRNEQLIYNALLTAVSDCGNVTEVINCSADMNDLDRAVRALRADRPDLVSLSCASFALDTGWGSVRADIEYSLTPDEIRECVTRVEARMNEVLSDVPEGLDDYFTVEFLHDAITSGCTCRAADRGENSLYFDSAYALCGVGSSAGYAAAMNILCRTAGLDCISVYGTYNGEPHVWNIVWCGGIPCHTDVSADDAEPVFAPDMSLHGYLCLSDGAIYADHIPDSSFMLPECGESGHDYYAQNGLYAADLGRAKEIIGKGIKSAAESGGDCIELCADFNCDADDVSDIVSSAIASEPSLPYKPVCRVINARGNSGAYSILLFAKR